MNEQAGILDENRIPRQLSSLPHKLQVPPSPGTTSVKVSYADADADISAERRVYEEDKEDENNKQQRRLVQVEAPRFLHALASSVSSSSGNALVQDVILDVVPALENVSDDSTNTAAPSQAPTGSQQPNVVYTDDQSSSSVMFDCGYDSRAWRQYLIACLENHSRDHREQAALLLSTFHQLRLRRGEDNVEARQELLLLTGPLGTGKTRLAKTLQKPVCDGLGGYFLTGKFDRLQRPAPYTAFVSAFAEFTNMVLSRGETEVTRMRRAIHQAVGDDVAVLTRMIPSLEHICGGFCHLYENSKAKADDALQRFVFVFRNFLRAVSCPEHPVVLFFDNIHWADPCSLDVLMSIVTDHQNRGLIVMCSCDNTAVSNNNDYLSIKLRELENKGGTTIKHFVVANLQESAVNDFLIEALSVPNTTSNNNNANKEYESLTQVVTRQTGGNPFDVIEFVCWLRESELLYTEEVTRIWCWDTDDIDITVNSRQVRDLVVDKLERLPEQVKDVLKVAACLGPYIDSQLIEFVLSVPVLQDVKIAESRGLIIYDDASGKFEFEHDGIQCAVYAMIPEAERELFHLEIGRRMWRRLDAEAVEQHIFTLLSQLHMGKRLITRETEKIAVATLCLNAGVKAARFSTFRIALIYLDFGISLLGVDSWRKHYELTLALHNAAAEMAMCNSKFERMDELVESVLHHAKLLLDKTQAYATRIYAMSVTNRQKEAIETGFEVLKGLGEPMPRRFSLLELRVQLKSVKKLLSDKSDEQLLRMPLMVDREKLVCLQILNLLFVSALFTQSHLVPFISLKMVKLTMKHGASVFASASFGTYGTTMLTVKHDIETAYRCGELGLKFLERFEAKEYLPRVHALFYGSIYAWKRPLKDVVEPLLEGYKVGLQTGDTEGAFLCANLYCLNSLEAGTPIPVVEREWEQFREAMAGSRHTSLLTITVPHLQLLHHLEGKSKDPLLSKGDLIDYDEELRRAKESNDDLLILVVRISRMILGFTFGDLNLAEEHLKVMKLIRKMPPNVKKVTSGFFAGLVMIACARDGRNVRKNLYVARKVIQIMDYLATLSPRNCLDKVFLLEAEYASVTGNNAVAYKKYTCALAMAKEAGFLWYTAIAYELAAHHLVRVGDRSEAKSFFEESCRYYKEYGALRKVDHLESEMKHWFASQSSDTVEKFRKRCK